ncbi:unnamed protein product [Clonostachys byssicola]|uniref:NADH:flavin oxidoreductase/NADH oxidase N-terminal domain-containing protein n=1 Tax=Clonostachys byssicola TaxID=160290 RepID=A0A9N9UJX0_9HYPO|nr:unnamed protein product [Clonostachys byssicola]
MSSLLEPITIGGGKLALRNRVVMGAMTRNRCVDDMKPGQAQIDHYSQRAKDGTGLIISEGIFIDWTGSHWTKAPVMISEDHCKAWQKVVDGVHQAGGKIFFQPWHAGRCQNDLMPALKERGLPVLAASPLQASGGKYRDLPGVPGHTANLTEIKNPSEIVNMYRRAVTLAKRAGFDGIELLAQGGYLVQQFLVPEANTRTDNYGGSVENRCRFLLEVVDAIGDVWGGYELICVKINPTDVLHDTVMTFADLKETYDYLIKELVARKVGIINISRRGTDLTVGDGSFTKNFPRPEGYPLPLGYDPVLDFGPLVKYPGSPSLLMANHEYTVEEADRLVKEGKLDLVTFARPFIWNPDLITRIKYGIPLAQNDRGDTVLYGPYTSPEQGYNDWPTAAA